MILINEFRGLAKNKGGSDIFLPLENEKYGCQENK